MSEFEFKPLFLPYTLSSDNHLVVSDKIFKTKVNSRYVVIDISNQKTAYERLLNYLNRPQLIISDRKESIIEKYNKDNFNTYVNFLVTGLFDTEFYNKHVIKKINLKEKENLYGVKEVKLNFNVDRFVPINMFLPPKFIFNHHYNVNENRIEYSLNSLIQLNINLKKNKKLYFL